MRRRKKAHAAEQIFSSENIEMAMMTTATSAAVAAAAYTHTQIIDGHTKT